MSEVDFSVDSVLNDARSKAGLEDFGASDFMPGLKVLLETYDVTQWSERGRKSKRRRVVDLLAARLRIEQAFKDHPAIRDERIVRPIYLTGLPRTGTSALLNLLANDTTNRSMKLWEGINPDPFQGFERGVDDPRYVQMKAWEEKNRKENPDFNKIHKSGADTPEECIHLLNHTFCDVQFGFELMLEPYASWFHQQDLSASYRYYADLLRMLQWQRPAERWLLKSPAHMWALDKVVENFPDACVVVTHRNPLEVVGSYCSMMGAMMKERTFDPKTLGPVVLTYLVNSAKTAKKHREQLSASQSIDIQYTDFVADPMSVAQTIYQHFDLPLSQETEQAMQAHIDSHPMNKHGKHEYGLGLYGLTEQQVLEQFEGV